MRAERPGKAVREELERAAFQRYVPERPPVKPPANVLSALIMLGEGGRLGVPYRGRVYELGFVSFADGIRLAEARAVIESIPEEESLSAENTERYLRALETVVSMAPKYLMPTTPVRRLLWRLRIRSNPFRSATDGEVGQLLGFFLQCRMRSRVRISSTHRGDPARI